MSEPNFRFIQPSDANSFHHLISNNTERLKRYFPITLSKTNNLEDVKKHLMRFVDSMEKKHSYPFGLFLDEKLQAVVIIKNIDWSIPKCELAYFIGKEQEGKGITTTLVNNTITYCFEELKMNKVFLIIDPANIGSVRVAEKNSFVKEGLLRREFKLENGEVVDMAYYGKLKEE